MKSILLWMAWRLRYLCGFLGKALPQDTRNISRVICILDGGIGDKLMALPAVRALRKSHPSARFRILFIGVGIPHLSKEFDEVSQFQRSNILGRIRAVVSGCDLIFVSSVGVFDVRNEVVALVSRAPIRIGPRFEHVKRTIYNRSYSFGGYHETIVNLTGVLQERPTCPQSYFLEIDARTKGDNVVGLHVSSSPGADCKRWAMWRFRELIPILLDNFDGVKVLGSATEAELVEQAVSGFDERVKPYSASNLEELATVVAQCRVVIGNDSGIVHLAASLRRPVVTIMAATDPQKCAPVTPWGIVVQQKCPREFCYWTPSVCERCIDSISPKEVALAVERVLSIADMGEMAFDGKCDSPVVIHVG